MVNLVSSVVDPTLPLKSEVKVVESMSSPPDPTSILESVETEVVALTQSSSCPSLPVESEVKIAEVFVIGSDCPTQGKIFSASIRSSPSTEVISFDWSNLTKSCIPLSVPLQTFSASYC